MILVEVCIDTAAGLAAALEGGADRIELCSALALGGLTPSAGLMALAAQAPIPVRAMIRPRSGHFRFDPAECDAMLRDIDAVRNAGLEGIVIGATSLSGDLDLMLLERLAAHARGMAITLHRVVDLLPDPVDAVDAAIALGVSTILTSGGAAKAIDGIERIAAMQERAGGRVEILAGGGITADNAPVILAATGIGSVHASCSLPAAPASGRLLELGFETAGRRETDRGLVAALRQATRPD
ncbi:copper homeostasis protein CutC [Sphingobium lactosutens]|uniref:copper homeostasis protein CutC n=1 Tax=Sphingobium lactosutens TaxID=522773 RepID=UPI0015B7A53C|nr:copper homeostasis protein CutC [Sphingobium lactosutens]NWK96393.1 copper homeostasis protein CutC [Sphingobium lactosutens]